MTTELTAAEKSAIRKLKNALSAVPKSLRLYVLDSSVYVCKVGVSADEFAEPVGHVTTPCAVLSDVHG